MSSYNVLLSIPSDAIMARKFLFYRKTRVYSYLGWFEDQHLRFFHINHHLALFFMGHLSLQSVIIAAGVAVSGGLVCSKEDMDVYKSDISPVMVIAVFFRISDMSLRLRSNLVTL